jgi:hypothetical protein
MRMSGADVHTVTLALGHKDLRMTMRYSHLSPAFLGDALGRLDGVLGDLRPRRSCPSGARCNYFKIKVPLTGLEPVVSALRGRRVNHLHYSGKDRTRGLVYIARFIIAILRQDQRHQSRAFTIVIDHRNEIQQETGLTFGGMGV